MSPQRHVLLITVDHWPATLLGCTGHPVIKTPTLDMLARTGVRFPQAYTECPVCIPARRTLLTGTAPRTHGDRTFEVFKPLPSIPTIADAFRENGYHTAAVGKLHVYPPRARAGFDEVLLCEEGRPQLGPTDDYEIYLGDQGLAGQQFLHGMSNNDYVSRPWHLDEKHHVTNWTTRKMARTIQRRDPTRPGFWYLSYTHPHPPLVPLQTYIDEYELEQIDLPFESNWSSSPDPTRMPWLMNSRLIDSSHYDERLIRTAHGTFYALCTHIDHQIRVVLGTLREEELLDDTIICFLADHGDMLGNHALWAKRLFYQDSASIPMILSGPNHDAGLKPGSVNNRLVSLQDVMPTLLKMAGLSCPDTVDGISMVGSAKRQWLYGEYGEKAEATRMIHDGRFKLIYFAYGNRMQLFDLQEDPREEHDLSQTEEHSAIRKRLCELLVEQSYGNDDNWVADGKLRGIDTPPGDHRSPRHLSLQRGSHWPIPPQAGGK